MTVDDDETVTATSRKSGEQADKDEDRFWRALKPSESTPLQQNDSDTQPQDPAADSTPSTVKPVDLAGDMQDLTDHERESRRHALRSMLAASEARQQGALRSRRPTLAIGERLLVCSGPYKNVQGIVLDADFIHSRVHLQLDGVDEAQWIEFARIAATLPL